MKTDHFHEFLSGRNCAPSEIAAAITAVSELEEYCKNLYPSQDLENIPVPLIQNYMDSLIKNERNDVGRVRSIARYFYMINNHDIYIQMTKYLGGLGVMECIRERVEINEGKMIADAIFNNLDPIPLGTRSAQMTGYTRQVMDRLENQLTQEQLEASLVGNNHRVSREAMLKEKEYYDQVPSLDQYLKDRHDRIVVELQQYCDEKKIWFEQVITQEVIDYVRSNQEILSAVRDGDQLYVTKIPYDTLSHLAESEPRKKAFYACHCPFARESILSVTQSISENWCYCSGGFEKFPFDVILGQELKVKVLNTALKDDPICRFEISLAGVEYKK